MINQIDECFKMRGEIRRGAGGPGMVGVAGCRRSKAGLNSPSGGKHKNIGIDLTCNRSLNIFLFLQRIQEVPLNSPKVILGRANGTLLPPGKCPLLCWALNTALFSRLSSRGLLLVEHGLVWLLELLLDTDPGSSFCASEQLYRKRSVSPHIHRCFFFGLQCTMRGLIGQAVSVRGRQGAPQGSKRGEGLAETGVARWRITDTSHYCVWWDAGGWGVHVIRCFFFSCSLFVPCSFESGKAASAVSAPCCVNLRVWGGQAVMCGSLWWGYPP